MAQSKPPPPPYRKPTRQKPVSAPLARPGRPAIDVDQIDRNINESLRRQVSEAIMKHPELVLEVLRGWKKTER